jgi:acyl-CoA hydrolase
MTAAEAAALVRPADTLGLGLGPANPHGLLTALSARDDFSDLVVGGALILGLFDLFTKPGVHYRSGFFGPAERYYRSVGGDVQLVPAGFRQFGPILRRMAPRVMAAQATEPDYRGFVNLSLHHGGTADELRRAGRDPDRLLMIESTPHLPRTRALDGYPNEIHVDEIDVLVRSDEHPVALPVEPRTDVDERIAAIAASFIADDATLQTGIGAVPSLVAEALAARENAAFGVHSEMFTDGLLKLHQAGRVRNQRKGIFDGISVTTFALGSTEMYEWLNGNEEVAFGPVHVVNDPTVISENRRFVSINGALSIDLYGQIVADAIGGHQISGVGGHEDFVAGAELGLDAVSLICLSSTIELNGVTTSRVLAGHPQGTVVSTPRHHTAVVVTEHGSADLRGLTVRERARALVQVADPQYREELAAAAERLEG